MFKKGDKVIYINESSSNFRKVFTIESRFGSESWNVVEKEMFTPLTVNLALIKEDGKLKIENKNLMVETPKEMIKLLSENHFEDMLKEIRDNSFFVASEEEDLIDFVLENKYVLSEILLRVSKKLKGEN